MQKCDEITKEMLTQLLRDNVVEIDFVKKNGEERKMRCTLSVDKFDYEFKDGEREIPENLLVVWDLENAGWRSMLVENIRSYMALREDT